MPSKWTCMDVFFKTHTLSCNKRRTSCSAALYSASLPIFLKKGTVWQLNLWASYFSTLPSYTWRPLHHRMAKLFEASRSLKYHEPVTPDQTTEAKQHFWHHPLISCHCMSLLYMTPIPTSYIPPLPQPHHLPTPNTFWYIEVPSPSPWRWMCPTCFNWWQWHSSWKKASMMTMNPAIRGFKVQQYQVLHLDMLLIIFLSGFLHHVPTTPPLPFHHTQILGFRSMVAST